MTNYTTERLPWPGQDILRRLPKQYCHPETPPENARLSHAHQRGEGSAIFSGRRNLAITLVNAGEALKSADAVKGFLRFWQFVQRP